MNRTPEEKAIGKDNFNAVIGETRRDFLKKGLAAGVVSSAGLGAMYFGYEATLKDPVRIGIIGTGDEGNVLIGALNPEFVEVKAIADIRPSSIHRAFHGDWSSDNAIKVRPGLMTKYGWDSEDEARKHVDVYTERYEDLLEDKDIEAVIIALPLHLHDVAAIKAMRAGKHVLTEKLMGHSVRQCKEMARVSQEEELLLATGHQRHYSILYDNAVDTIRRGLIGDLHFIRAQWHRGNLPGRDSWQPPLPPPPDIDAAKAGSDLKKQYPLIGKYQSWTRKLKSVAGTSEEALWQKRVDQLNKQLADYIDAAQWGYEEKTLQSGSGTYVRSALEELIRWRLWNRTGGGLMAELGSHQLDASGIFISAQFEGDVKVKPLSVTAVGGRQIFPFDREVDDHVYCTYEYPGKGYFEDNDPTKGEADTNKKVVVTYSSINGNGFGGYGETVMGTNGTLVLEKEKDVQLYGTKNVTTRLSAKEKDNQYILDTTASGDDIALGQVVTEEVSRGYKEEIEHWAWCIRNNPKENKPRCHPEVALADAVIALTTNIAIKDQRRIEFTGDNKQWFNIDSDLTPEGKKPRKPSEITT